MPPPVYWSPARTQAYCWAGHIVLRLSAWWVPVPNDPSVCGRNWLSGGADYGMVVEALAECYSGGEWWVRLHTKDVGKPAV
jgi:hypothetical protein